VGELSRRGLERRGMVLVGRYVLLTGWSKPIKRGRGRLCPTRILARETKPLHSALSLYFGFLAKIQGRLPDVFVVVLREWYAGRKYPVAGVRGVLPACSRTLGSCHRGGPASESKSLRLKRSQSRWSIAMCADGFEVRHEGRLNYHLSLGGISGAQRDQF